MTTQTKPIRNAKALEGASGQLNIRLDQELMQRLISYCARYSVPKASLVREGLIRELDRRDA